MWRHKTRLNQLFVGLAIFVSICYATNHSGTASGGWEVWELGLAKTWSKFRVRENLKLRNHSNNYELSGNAIKMTFFLKSSQKIIMKWYACRNSQVASTATPKQHARLVLHFFVEFMLYVHLFCRTLLFSDIWHSLNVTEGPTKFGTVLQTSEKYRSTKYLSWHKNNTRIDHGTDSEVTPAYRLQALPPLASSNLLQLQHAPHFGDDGSVCPHPCDVCGKG